MAFRKYDWMRRDDEWTFSSNVHPSSFAKVLDDSDQMTGEEVLAFIDAADRSLVKRLRGLPIRSSDIPLSFHGQRTLQRLPQYPQAIYAHQQSSTNLADRKRITEPTSIYKTMPAKPKTSHAEPVDKSQLLLDGVSQQVVLEAAERLYPAITPRKLRPGQYVDKKGYEEQAFNFPSNSPKNKALRAHKQFEIEETLKEVEKYEKTRSGYANHDTFHTARSIDFPDVTITRPAYVEPIKERYKKQGLTNYDYKLDLKKRHAEGWYEKKQPSHALYLQSSYSRIPNVNKIDAAEIRPKKDDANNNVDMISPLSARFAVNEFDNEDSYDAGKSMLEQAVAGSVNMNVVQKVYKWKAVQGPYSPHSEYSTNESKFGGNAGYTSDTTCTTSSEASEVETDNQSTTIVVALHRDSLSPESDDSSSEVSCTSNENNSQSSYCSTRPPSALNTGSSNSNTDSDSDSPLPSIDPPSYSTFSTLTDDPSDSPSPPQTPKTPARTPEYKSSKPWGTPINYTPSTLLDKFEMMPIQTPPSPTPTKKRKLGEMEGPKRVLDY